MKKTILVGLLGSCLALCAYSQPASPKHDRQWVTSAIDVPHLQYHTFESESVGTTVSYHIYVPPAYEQNKQDRFPVLYWLHGSGDGLKGLPMAVKHFERAIQSGKIPPMLVAFIQGKGTMWCNSKDEGVPMETVIVDELIPEIDARFRTVATPEGRMVEGFSMGGYGAARLGFKYPDIFGAVSMLSPGPMQLDFLAIGPRSTPRARKRILELVYGGDIEYFRAQSPWVLAEQNAETLQKLNMPMRLLIGEQDEMLPVIRAFVAHLNEIGLSLIFKTYSNIGHNPRLLVAAFDDDDWRFYRKVLSVADHDQEQE